MNWTLKFMANTYNLPQQKTLIDATIQLYGSLDNAIALSSLNGYSLGSDFTDKNIELIYDKSISLGKADTVVSVTVQEKNLKLKAQTNQTVIDLCLQCLTNLDNLVNFANENNVNIYNTNNTFKIFNFNIDDIDDINIRNEITSNNISFASGRISAKRYILQENKRYILQENGFKLILI